SSCPTLSPRRPSEYRSSGGARRTSKAPKGCSSRSRYSSSLPRSCRDGSSRKTRPPTSTAPSTFQPRSDVWAEAAPGAATATRTAAISAALRVGMAGLLAREGEAGGVVRPVDVDVAVAARAAEHELQRAGIRPVRPGRMPGLHVALLAQARPRELEHLVVVAAVGVVAVQAALRHRGVLPEERPALLGMAGVAGLVDRVLLEERRGDRAVRVVARRAGHLPLAERHVGGLELGRPLLDVALPAGLDLGRQPELRLGRDVPHHLVAVGA